MEKHKALIMSILNITPDSFFEKSRAFSFKSALLRAQKLVEEGADILDIGGESTRPGAIKVSEEEEIKRTIPLIKELKNLNISISIDTYKPTVAKKALENGASFINDISGFRSAEMIKIAKEFDVDICAMHMQNTPQTMQKNPFYPNGAVNEIYYWFEKTAEKLIKAGIKKEKIILDPGIGFGKSVQDNLDIINNIPKFKSLDLKLLFGISRKSFMGKIVTKSCQDLLPATLIINTIILREGVDIIRVHDTKEHKDLIKILDALKKTTFEKIKT